MELTCFLNRRDIDKGAHHVQLEDSSEAMLEFFFHNRLVYTPTIFSVHQ